VLGDDGAGGNNDHRPVELAFEVLHNLLVHLTHGDEGAVGNADEECLTLSTVGLLVFNQISAVDEDLSEVLLQSGGVHL